MSLYSYLRTRELWRIICIVRCTHELRNISLHHSKSRKTARPRDKRYVFLRPLAVALLQSITIVISWNGRIRLWIQVERVAEESLRQNKKQKREKKGERKIYIYHVVVPTCKWIVLITLKAATRIAISVKRFRVNKREERRQYRFVWSPGHPRTTWPSH